MPGPGDLYGVFAGVAANSAGQSILYAFGGTTSGEGGSGFSTRAYNLATNIWTTKTSQVYVFESNGVGKIGSKLYFSGGYDYRGGSREIVWTTWAYDPATDRLIRKADMPKATADGVSGVIDGKLWVLPSASSTATIRSQTTGVPGGHAPITTGTALVGSSTASSTSRVERGQLPISMSTTPRPTPGKPSRRCPRPEAPSGRSWEPSSSS